MSGNSWIILHNRLQSTAAHDPRVFVPGGKPVQDELCLFISALARLVIVITGLLGACAQRGALGRTSLES